MVSKNKNTGFTIVELLIVIVVIGILAALVLNSFSGAQAKARDTKRLTDFSALKNAMEFYLLDHGEYPRCWGDTSTNRAGCGIEGIQDALVPEYLSQSVGDPLNQPPTHQYYYAMGYKKGSDGYTHYLTDSPSDYSIGTFLETKEGPTAPHWGATINHMDGN